MFLQHQNIVVVIHVVIFSDEKSLSFIFYSVGLILGQIVYIIINNIFCNSFKVTSTWRLFLIWDFFFLGTGAICKYEGQKVT